MSNPVKIFTLSLLAIAGISGSAVYGDLHDYQNKSAYVLKNNKLINKDFEPLHSAADHYKLGLEAVEAENWKEANRQFRVIEENFPDFPLRHDLQFFLGASHYHQDNCELADRALTAYLKSPGELKYFDRALEYKFGVAEKYRLGAKRHLLGFEMMPKWIGAQEDGIRIFDEVITAVPHGELACKALFSKAALLYDMRAFEDAVEAYQALIRRFPRDELAAESFLAINRLYLQQAKKESNNSYILELASVNVRKFAVAFPSDPRQEEAQKAFSSMREVFARGLVETGEFYERTGHPKAAAMYFTTAFRKFPGTEAAAQCQDKLQLYGGTLAELGLDQDDVL